jgi:hypothetical protein
VGHPAGSIFLHYSKIILAQSCHYGDIRERIKEETEKQSFQKIRAFEKIMRSPAKERKLSKERPVFSGTSNQN